MLTAEQEYILYTIRKSMGLCNCIPENNFLCPDSESVQTIVKMILHNGILLTVYPILSSPLQRTLHFRYSAYQKQAIMQQYEGEQILKALGQKGLDCIGLKGWEIRKLYPDITRRQMADLDILVRPYNYSIVKDVMERMGYEAQKESVWKHDNFTKGKITVEIHKRLTDDIGLIREWELQLWKRAVPVEEGISLSPGQKALSETVSVAKYGMGDGHILRMSLEDFFIFHIVHLHKDYLKGALGLRRIIDTWLLHKQLDDMGKVRGELEKFGMWQFCTRMINLSRVAMGEAQMDASSEFLISYALTHRIYGSEKSYKTGRIAMMGSDLKSGKLRSALAAIFLPYDRMKAQFPVLDKWPVLLPWCWIRRILRLLRGDVKKYRRLLDYKYVSVEDYEEMKRFFEAGGIL